MKDTFEKNTSETLAEEVKAMLKIQRQHCLLTELLKAKKVVVLDLFKQNGLGKITIDNKSVVLNKATKIKKVNYQQVIISIVDSGKIPESVVNSLVEQNTTFTEKKRIPKCWTGKEKGGKRKLIMKTIIKLKKQIEFWEKQIEVLEKLNNTMEDSENGRKHLPNTRQIPHHCDEFQVNIDFAIDDLHSLIKSLKVTLAVEEKEIGIVSLSK